MSRITVLHTIETAGPGGAETVLLNLASKLDPSRFRSIAMLPEGRWLPGQLRAREIPTFCVESKGWHDLTLPKSMAQLVRTEKVDLIHSHLPDQNFYSCVVGHLTRSKTIATYHGAVEVARARRKAFKLWVVRKTAAAVVVVCDFVADLLKGVDFPAGKLVRIYNGIELSRFQVSANGLFRDSLGLDRDDRLVGTVANLRQSKGYEFLIRAARKVLDAVPRARFLAVGEIDQELGNKYFSLVEKLGLTDRFTFLGFRKDVAEILSNLDLFVLPSTSEGFPLVLLEAMAAGRPVVATRSGGPQEIVEDGQTGLLVPPGDAEALAKGIEKLLVNPEQAADLGRNARGKVEREFSLEKMVSQYEALYERCLDSV